MGEERRGENSRYRDLQSLCQNDGPGLMGGGGVGVLCRWSLGGLSSFHMSFSCILSFWKALVATSALSAVSVD